MENKDKSSISYKQFNLTPLDKYPTFSVCLKGPEIYWNQEKLLFDRLGITSAQYAKLLTGKGIKYQYNETSGLYHKESIDPSSDTSKILEFEDVSMHPSNIILGVDFVTEQDNHTAHYGSGKEGSKLKRIPFYIGYQTPMEICFTRNSSYSADLTKVYDLLSLNKSMLDPGNHLNIQLRIIIHYPNQLFRSFDNPSFQSTLNAYTANKVLELKVSHVTILRKRKDSNVPCNETIENDDFVLQTEILDRIDCIPVYWKNLMPKHGDRKLCRSQTELERAHYHILRYKDIISTYDPPCVDMTTLVTVVRDLDQRKRHFRIKVQYTESFYQEIKNVRDFSFEIFWSSVGGFVGMCLGYSALQIPDLLLILPSLIREVKCPKSVSKFFMLQ